MNEHTGLVLYSAFLFIQKASDFKIGQILNVFGRKVVLRDCDEFTRKFSNRNNVGEFVMNEIPKPTTPHSTSADVGTSTYPNDCMNCIKGSETNRLLNELKERQRNMKKFLEQNNTKLTFKAQMLTNTNGNTNREFVITYYLDDSTISVFEIGGQNVNSSVREKKKHVEKQ